jgi:repressor of nif and glnA expression
VIGTETQDVERKAVSILKILSDSTEPLGATVLARHLRDHGIDLSERAVRYHLKIMDERGLTQLVGRDGRAITPRGLEELERALAFRTNFDFDTASGPIPANVTVFPRDAFPRAVRAMRPAFEEGFCVSDLVAVAHEGQHLGELVVPADKVGFATVCSVAINGVLLKAGVPMDSRFGGILEIRNRVPRRFVELIHYAGSSLDPSEVFIRARMTSVGTAAASGSGNVLANYREIPAICREVAQDIIAKLSAARLGGLVIMGEVSEPVCEIPIELNRVGIILLGGLNPVAAAREAGIEAQNHAMSTTIDYKDFISFKEM